MSTVLLSGTQPYASAPEDGQVFWLLGVLATVKATSAQTGGAFSLIDLLCPPGYATPLQIHYAEDVTFYVVEGTIDVLCDGERVRAERGTVVFQPRGAPHGFQVAGEASARILCLTIPAGLDRLVQEHGETVNSPAAPRGALPDVETLAEVLTKYKIEVLGPLPD
jgi:mannose-6-phosphate isomerase-like protein (cupin superfamily)